VNPQETWPTRFTRAAATEIQRHRKMRGWSAQKLSDECAVYGLDMPRSTLADLENGRRASLGVAELVIIAKALDVPPLQLLFPVGYAAESELLPGEERGAFRSAMWFSGEGPFPGIGDDAYLVEITSDWIDANGGPLSLYRAYDRALDSEMNALRRARQMDERAATGDELQREAFSAAAAALRQTAEQSRAGRESVRREAERLGLRPPGQAGAGEDVHGTSRVMDAEG
jgi:transcriptional regulator with XRE-family HTH domain